MAKNLTIKAFCICIVSLLSGSGMAQSYLIKQDFTGISGTTPPSGWVNNMSSGVSGLDMWQYGKHPKFFFAPPFDNNYAIFDSYNGGSAGGTATNGQGEVVSLESPVINTVGRSNLNFSFDFTNLGIGGWAYLEVSTNGGTSWSTFASYSQVTAIPVSVSYNFGSYIGYANFKFRFRWENLSTASYQGFFAVDNIALTETLSKDVTITALAPMYDKSCPSSTQPITVTIKNAGNSTIDSVPVTVNVSGAASAVLNGIWRGSLSAGSSTTYTIGNINTTAGGTFNFQAITRHLGDVNILNDTFKASRTSAAIAGNPTAINGSACGQGSRVSIGATKNAGDSTFWYSQSSGGNFVGLGNPFLTPPINKTTTFYAQNTRFFNNEQFAYQGPYRFNGNQYTGSYFNVTVNNDMLVDSFWQHFAYAGLYTVKIYYRVGGHNGFETNSSAWTLLDTRTVNSNGYGHMVGLKLTSPLSLPAGNTYGFYIIADGSTTLKSITFKLATVTFTNADLTLNAGLVSSDVFNALNYGYSWDGRIFYRKLCQSNRVAVTATIKPRPVGATAAMASPFQGKYRVGDVGTPDLLEINKTNTYELTPPTGHSTATEGISWKYNGIMVKTINGYTVPPGFYTITAPTSSNNAKITFNSSTALLDSSIRISFMFADLGPNFCDSVVSRVVRVVPTPRTNFSFPSSICDGSSVEFRNLSTIHSGTMTYVWHFTPTDSSDVFEPIYTFPGPGVYQVKLVATSIPFGIVKDTTIQVRVYDIPKVVFRPVNACEGTAVQFVNTSSITSGTLTYDWDFGDASAHSTAQNPTHLYATQGGYPVTLTASANGCSNSMTRNAYQFAMPVADFTAPNGSICAGAEVVLPNNSTISSGDMGSFWDFDDGVKSTSDIGKHAYSVDKTYNVKLSMVSEFGCTNAVVKPVTVKPAPKAGFTTSRACSLEPTILTNTTTYATGQNPAYTWTFSDGGTATTTNVSRSWPSIGPKTITLKAVQANGCTGTVTKDIEVLVQPDAKFTVANICSGEGAIFENQTTVVKGDVNYKWYFGDSDSSDVSDPVHTYNTGSTITRNITLVAQSVGGCSDTASGIITVSEIPVCSFTKEVNWVNGYRSIRFKPTNSTYSSYTWYFGEGGSSNATSPVYQYLYDGHFNVTLKARNGAGCECQSVVLVNIGRDMDLEDVADNGGVSIYPNPNTGKFIVEIEGAGQGGDCDIEIYNTVGERIQVIHVTGDGSTDIDLSNAAKGIYIVKVKAKGKVSTRKVSVN